MPRRNRMPRRNPTAEKTDAYGVQSRRSNAKPASDAKPAADTKREPRHPKGPEPAKAAPAAKSSGSSSDVRRSPFRLVAFADDKPADKAAQTKDEKKDPAPSLPLRRQQNPPAKRSPQRRRNRQKRRSRPTRRNRRKSRSPTTRSPTTARNPTPERRRTRVRTPSPPRPIRPRRMARARPAPLPPIKTAEQRLREKIRDEIAQENLQNHLAKIQTKLGEYRQEWVQLRFRCKEPVEFEKAQSPPGLRGPGEQVQNEYDFDRPGFAVRISGAPLGQIG